MEETPKQKAWQLIDDFFKLVEFDLDKNQQILRSIKVAFRTVEEILKSNPSDVEYWKDVNNELNIISKTI